MSIQSISASQNSFYSLDEILQDTHETATEELIDNEKTYQNYQEALNEELKTTDRVWLEFHAGQCEQFGKAAKSILYRIVKASVGNPENSIAAANAITILKVMKVSFSCLDLRGVQMYGADLSSAILDRSDISGANLESANLTNASLNGTNMLNALLEKVKFDIPDILFHESDVFTSIVSPDNKYLVSEDSAYIYFWHLPRKVCIKKIKKPDSYFYIVKIFTPDGRFLFIFDNKQTANIFSVGNFEHIKKFTILDKEFELQLIRSSFFPNKPYFITYYYFNFINYSYLYDNKIYYFNDDENDDEINLMTYVKVWKINEIENTFLNINLEKESIQPYFIMDIRFSEKFPILYCLKVVDITLEDEDKRKSRIDLGILDIEILSEIANIPNIVELYDFTNVERLFRNWGNTIVSLDILDTDKDNEELLIIAYGCSIYSVCISKKNEQSWALGLIRTIKIINETDIIYNMKVLTKTHEVTYICNNIVFLYSILNNQYIGKYRLYDIPLPRLPISLDRTNIYINNSHRISLYSLEALKKNKYISYEIDSAGACFSPNMRTIISISKSLYMTMYDIETGTTLNSHVLQKVKSHILNRYIEDILFSLNAQYILISSYYSSDDKLDIINAANEEIYFEEPVDAFILSNNSEYLACIQLGGRLTIYKIIPSMHCIGEFFVEFFGVCLLAISTDFLKTPKIAFISKLHQITVYNFVFKDQKLELLSQKTLSLKKYDYLHEKFLHLQFTKNNNELIIVCKQLITIWDIERDLKVHYEISATCAGISQDTTLLIYFTDLGLNTNGSELCLWSITQRKLLIIQPVSFAIDKLQISLDNKYILATTKNGGIYVWKALEGSLRLLWRMSHNLQAQGLILGNNKLENKVEEDLITKMDAMKIADK